MDESSGRQVDGHTSSKNPANRHPDHTRIPTSTTLWLGVRMEFVCPCAKNTTVYQEATVSAVGVWLSACSTGVLTGLNDKAAFKAA